MKKLLACIILPVYLCICFSPVAFAQEDKKSNADDPFVLIPKADSPTKAADAVTKLGDKSSSEDFSEIYNDEAEKLDIGGQFASGIMNWNTILTLLGRVTIFIANSALVVGSAMIIYAGYMYVTAVYVGDNTSKANEAIKYALIGIVVVIFSYAIVRIAIHMFL